MGFPGGRTPCYLALEPTSLWQRSHHLEYAGHCARVVGKENSGSFHIVIKRFDAEVTHITCAYNSLVRTTGELDPIIPHVPERQRTGDVWKIALLTPQQGDGMKKQTANL